MDSLLNKDSLCCKIIYTLLATLLILVISPIIYYGYQHYKIRLELTELKNPSSLAANRYLYTGDWPASKENNSIITDSNKFKLTINEAAEGSEINAQ